jgi:hypothetical protein
MQKLLLWQVLKGINWIGAFKKLRNFLRTGGRSQTSFMFCTFHMVFYVGTPTMRN